MGYSVSSALLTLVLKRYILLSYSIAPVLAEYVIGVVPTKGNFSGTTELLTRVMFTVSVSSVRYYDSQTENYQ
jgi:hypothetical protein